MASPAKQESLRTSWSVRSKSPKSGSPRTVTPASPVHLSRSFGADSFQAELLRSKSLSVPVVNDFKTECLGTIAECDVRCALAVGPEIWVGLRDGSIAIRTTEKLETVVEPRKGVVVWSLLEVGATVWAGCSDGFIRVYAQGSHKLEKQFARHGGGGGGVHALVLHAPSHTVFSASNDFEILAWDSRTGDFLRQLAGHSSAVRALVLDAITLYSGGDDGKVILWDIATFDQVAEFTGHTKGVHSLTLTSQNTLWSGSEDGTIRIWDLTKRAAVSDALTQTGSVEALLSIGDRVWSGSGDTVYIWDAASYQLLGTFVAHTGYVNTIVVVNRVSHFQIWTAGTDQIKSWRSEFSPDESSVLVRKLARCGVTEFDHHRVAGQLARRQAELADVTARLRAAEEELGRLHWLNEENARLRAAAEESDRRRIAAEQKADALEAQQQSSDRLIAELRQDNRRLTDELAAALAKAAELSQELVQQQRLANLQIDALRNKVEDLTSLTNVLKEEIRQHRADNADLTSRLAKAEAERDEVLAKLKDLDSLFKSRLSLITSVYQTYQRLETTEKRLRGNPQTARDEVHAVLAEFRNVIAKHYTGDELVHLGTSRHFFPL